MTNLLQGNDTVWVAKHQAEEGSCWGEVMLNRPERKNAIVGPLGLGLAEGIAALDADPDVQAIVLRGAGGAFARVWIWQHLTISLSLNGCLISNTYGAGLIVRYLNAARR